MPMTTSQTDQARRNGEFSLAVFVPVFAVFNLVAPAFAAEIQSEVIVAITLGAVVAQFGLLAIWAVLGSQRLLVRWPLTLLATALLYWFALAGMAIAGMPGRALREAAWSTLLVPAIFLAVQLPLWLFKAAVGCRIAIADADDSSEAAPSRQFGLQEMFGATTAMALVFGLARAGLSGLDRTGDLAGSGVNMWSYLGAACLFCALWSTFITVPCVAAVFLADSRAAGSVAMLVYTLMMSLFVSAVISSLTHPEAFGRGFVYLFAFNVGIVLVMLGCLNIARACGYVLLRAAGKPDESEDADE